MNFKFSQVCLEAVGYTLPAEVWTSADIEDRLLPLYERLKLPAGRLELMTGIAERGFWPMGVLPSVLSAASCQRAMEIAQVDPQRVGCLLHGSVCRDFLEPATACAVHHQLGLRQECLVHDVSNACLGLLNGALIAASLIESNQIDAALVVGSEGGRQLVETTINALNADLSLTRKTVKDAFASLTIGSASCAWLLVHRRISRTGNLLLGGTSHADTKWHRLCLSVDDQSASNFSPLMSTDSQELLVRGVETARATFGRFLQNMEWQPSDIHKMVCHQVGSAHQKLMCETLQLDPAIDYSTYPWLGNTGAAALPITLAVAAERGHLQAGDQVGLFGIGSGINCLMLGCLWQKSLISGGVWSGD
ncbi:MAG TPA: 3-oxoacyl-ACP synthase III [Pirellulaceae bacterium]|nr:3-oxoacyl-ACP synthase III [Pirellulaceae bacterium]